jgi:hypothetical protein
MNIQTPFKAEDFCKQLQLNNTQLQTKTYKMPFNVRTILENKTFANARISKLADGLGCLKNWP